MKRLWTVSGLAVVAAGALVACGSDAQPASDSSTPPGITAVTPSPAGTSTITITSVPLTPTTPATEADPAAYAVAGSPGAFRWSYAHDPLRECSLSPAMNGLTARITCSAPFPPDAPTISVDVFNGQPNAIVLTNEGTEPTIVEGGPAAAPDLPAGSRLTFGDLACTARPNNSITCTSPDAWFTVQNGVLATS
ncbi:hypothetical protein [Gordonia phthalatica]|uniref:hypothetical protein n=1 Tax=Gordonia phthalatica TaxID=1136941 RepID=UPI0012FE9288|nr:hypothetical protein [Gordonia phthalatica]